MLGLLSNIERIIIAVLLVIIIFSACLTYQSNKKLNSANTIIENQSLKIENAEIQAEYLTQSIDLSEQSNAKLLKERDSLAKINEQYSKDIVLLNVQHAKSLQKITELRSSTNESTKHWAIACVPADAISLLKYARTENCHKNSRSNSVQVHSSTN